MTPHQKAQEKIEEFANLWPLPKILALSGEGVKRDFQLMWLRQTFIDLLSTQREEIKDFILKQENRAAPPEVNKLVDAHELVCWLQEKI